MLENVLTNRNVSLKGKIACKTIVSAVLIALSVLIPQLVHLAVGAEGGVKYLPMYLPVLIGGCLLGMSWGLSVGILAPVMSFIITSAMGNPMPALQRLPFMILELGVFALVSGAFTKKISENTLWAFPVVILSQLAGRGFFLLTVALFGSLANMSVAMIWGQIQKGLLGLVIQAVLAPVIIILLGKAVKND